MSSNSWPLLLPLTTYVYYRIRVIIIASNNDGLILKLSRTLGRLLEDLPRVKATVTAVQVASWSVAAVAYPFCLSVLFFLPQALQSLYAQYLIDHLAENFASIIVDDWARGSVHQCIGWHQKLSLAAPLLRLFAYATPVSSNGPTVLFLSQMQNAFGFQVRMCAAGYLRLGPNCCYCIGSFLMDAICSLLLSLFVPELLLPYCRIFGANRILSLFRFPLSFIASL